MKNTTKSISKLITSEVIEFFLYSYNNKLIHHEYFAKDKYSNNWCHDIYDINEDTISEYELYEENNLNEYLINSDRNVEDDISENDIISRVYNSSKNCSIIVKDNTNDILEHFMKNKDKFDNKVLYAIIPTDK